MAIMLLIAGCRSMDIPSEMILTSPYPMRDSMIPVVTDNTNSLGLGAVAAYALGTSPRIHRFEARVGVAAGDLAQAHTMASPEVRIGTGQSHAERRGWDSQTETGTSLQTGRESTYSSDRGIEAGESERTVYGIYDESTESLQHSRSDSTRSTTSSKESQSEVSSQRESNGDQIEQGFELGFRFSPPNPWERRAAITAAEAGKLTAQAELVEEEYRLVYDIFDIAIRIAYHQRMILLSSTLVSECESIRTRIESPTARGLIPRTDYVDTCLRTTAAKVNLENLAARAASLEKEFRRLTGIGHQRVDFQWIKAGAIYLIPASNGFGGVPEGIMERALERPDVVAAYWHLLRCRSEWKQARARQYPWFSHIAASYSWWDKSEQYGRASTKQRFESTTSSQHSTGQQSSFQSEEKWTSQGEYETGSSSEVEHERSRSEGSARETEQSIGQERGMEDALGDEWWVECGVEIPVFEWFSKESMTRRQSERNATLMFHSTLARAREEIRLSHQTMTASQAGHYAELGNVDREVSRLNEMAAVSRMQGFAGELEALRIRERVIDLTRQLMERAMGSALNELDMCRVAALLPGQSMLPAGKGTAPLAPTEPDEKKASKPAVRPAEKREARPVPTVAPILMERMLRREAELVDQFRQIDNVSVQIGEMAPHSGAAGR